MKYSNDTASSKPDNDINNDPPEIRQEINEKDLVLKHQIAKEKEENRRIKEKLAAERKKKAETSASAAAGQRDSLVVEQERNVEESRTVVEKLAQVNIPKNAKNELVGSAARFTVITWIGILPISLIMVYLQPVAFLFAVGMIALIYCVLEW